MKKIILPCIFLFFGLFTFFHPAIFDFSKMPLDGIDVAFINYILEHGFLWIKGDIIHQNFWTLPMFYPNQNTLCYSDVLLGGMLFYIPLRFLFNSEISLYIWIILISILNFFSFFLVSRKIFKFNSFISSILSFFFAFSLPLYNQLVHLQLFCQFFAVFSLYFFLLANKRKSYYVISAVLLVLEFYTSFYLFWFVIFGFLLAIFIMCLKKNTREILINYVKTNSSGLFVFVSVLILLSLPLVLKYYSIGTGFSVTARYLLRNTSFLTSYSLLDSYILKNLQSIDVEAVAGVGLLTSLFIIIGFFKLKKYKFQVFLFIFFCILFFSDNIFHTALAISFPGASAIRAGGRIIFLLMPVFCYLLGMFFNNQKKVILVLCVFIFMVEQIPYSLDIQKTRNSINNIVMELENKIPKHCEAFYIDFDNEPLYQMSAVLLGNKIKKYTVNGYSGYTPNRIQELSDKTCIIKK